ncbi:hypothetical protein CK203_065071 [Vitis vinifera]|uniref:Uncharacterized protein n=1 Tax=Vitis vinifera TaxID=29760 RepID=A0A438FP95_VITVI|nr:hypothetical protein CK203_065071 [Vitis vinifera]
MGGLKAEIAYGIRMFKPKSLKEAINLASMQDEQLNRHETATCPFNRTTIGSSPTKIKTLSPMKQLTWAEMQRRHAQGLCFNCDEKFAPRHKCKGPQLLLLEGNYDERKMTKRELTPTFEENLKFHSMLSLGGQRPEPCKSRLKWDPMN